MPLVFVATAQKIAMELLDMVFRDRNLGPGKKDGLHHFGITGQLPARRGWKIFLISRLDSRRSTSRSVELAASMRVEEPMLSMVATWRRAFNRSGASVPKERHAPLNSSISASTPVAQA